MDHIVIGRMNCVQFVLIFAIRRVNGTRLMVGIHETSTKVHTTILKALEGVRWAFKMDLHITLFV